MHEYNKRRPPKWSTRFLSWFMKEEYYEDIQGDLEEEFQLILENKTILKAKNWYSWQILRLFRPAMMKKVKPQEYIEKENSMFKNYIKIGFRNLLRYKSGTIINAIGLSLGLSAFILIGLFIKDELSYDRHHKHAENIYRATVKNYNRDGSMNRHWAFASAGHAPLLKEDYQEIEHAVRFFPSAFPDLTYGDKKFPAEQVIFTDTEVFDVFSFKFIKGNPETALEDLFSIVLTESSAIKIFGNDWREQNILDKQIVLSRNGQQAPFKVTAVMQDMPDQQHFHFEYLAPIRFVAQILGEETIKNVGGNYNWPTYMRLSEGTDIESLQAKVNREFWDKYIGELGGGLKAHNFYDFYFQPLVDIHLNSDLEGEFEANGSIQQVIIFSIVAILLLLVACVNYMNIATSHYSRRMKEVGVRKVIGAYRSSLVKQFLVESLIMTIISLPISMLLVYLALPYLNNFADKQLVFNLLTQWDLALTVILLTLAVGVLAGLYPSLFLSRTSIIQSLKGVSFLNNPKWDFRSATVTFQYAVTIGLIFAVVVIDGQMRFIQKTDPGYEKEQVLVLNMSRSISNRETFKNELLSHPNIREATYSSRIPTGRLLDNWGTKHFKGDSAVDVDFRLPFVSVDENFLETYGIPLVAGENFKDDMKTILLMDSITPGYYIINEEASRRFGYTNPSEIIGEKIQYGYTNGRIIGVMKDFHFESMHNRIVPMVIVNNTNRSGNLSMLISTSNINETLQFIEKTYASFDPSTTAAYNFLDELFKEQYTNEQRLSTLIKLFSGITGIISCLGLIGMVGFIVETKIKEIGIRKVMGASVPHLLMLISNRFLLLIGLALLVALPVAWYLMSGWLENFVYRTNLSFEYILIPVAAIVILTALTISYQTVKATLVNPVECLKNE